MPLPVIAGASVLTVALTRIGTFLFEFFIGRTAKRVALNIAYLGMVATLFAGFAAVLQALITGLYYVSPAPLAKAIGFFVPPVLPLVVAAYFTAHLAEFVFAIKVKISKPYKWVG